MSHALRSDALRIMRAAIAAVDPGRIIGEKVSLEGDTLVVEGAPAAELGEGAGVWVIGAGKASPAMAGRLVEILGGRFRGGTIAAPPGNAPAVQGVEVWEAGHPVPTMHSVAAAATALATARSAGRGDLVVCALSGGASALWAAPERGLTLDDLRRTTTALLRAGAPISEVNTVRKHLSRIAGGRLARAAAPAGVLTLAVSDVIGATPDVIGSGPTLPDPTTFADALGVLRRRAADVPLAVTELLTRGAAGSLPETPKPGELDNISGFHLLASIREALQGAQAEAQRLGYRAELVDSGVEGEARQVGSEVAQRALRELARRDGPVALLWGGETTVTVRGDGKGGRNQEVALSAALTIDTHTHVAIASFGTDGVDGPTDAAGALVDGGTAARGRAAGLDPHVALDRNDAYTFLRSTGDLLVTGPSGTNVNDICLALIG